MKQPIKLNPPNPGTGGRQALAQALARIAVRLAKEEAQRVASARPKKTA